MRKQQKIFPRFEQSRRKSLLLTHTCTVHTPLVYIFDPSLYYYYVLATFAAVSFLLSLQLQMSSTQSELSTPPPPLAIRSTAPFTINPLPAFSPQKKYNFLQHVCESYSGRGNSSNTSTLEIFASFLHAVFQLHFPSRPILSLSFSIKRP